MDKKKTGSEIEKVGDKKPPKHSRFKKWVRPPATNEQKKAWRDRKREMQRLMDKMISYQNMKPEAFKQMIEAEKHDTMLDLMVSTRMQKIVGNEKLLAHYIDKLVPNAPTQVSGADDWPITLNIDWDNPPVDSLLQIVKNRNKK